MRDALFDHIETPQCGFDRNASHAAGHYVCACGYAEQRAVLQQRIKELTENGQRLIEAADGWKASAQHFQRERNELEAQLAEVHEQLRLCNIDQSNSEAENAALREKLGQIK